MLLLSKIDPIPLQAVDCLRTSMLQQQEVIEQVAHLLYLKWIDETDARRRAEGSEAIFEGSAMRYTWAEWSCLVDSEMHDVLRNRVFPFLGALVKVDPEVGEYFRSVKMEIESPRELRKIVDLIGKLQLLQMPELARGALMQNLLKELPASPGNGQMFTPDPLRDLLVQIARPKAGDSILDPCCGAGVLLGQALAAAQRVELSPAESPAHSLSGHVKGVELVWSLARLARLNLIFLGQSGSFVSCGNSLDPAGPLSEQELNRGYSLVIANPPFGGRESLDKLRADLVLDSRHTELLFLALAMKALAPGGRAVVVVPEGLLVGTSPVHMDLRRRLLEEFDVHAVISLGGRGVMPVSGLKMSVLVFSRSLRVQAKRDRLVWFYEFSLPSKRQQAGRVGEAALGAFVPLWDSYARHGFNRPPGVNAEEILRPNDPEPAGWWASVETILASGGILSVAHHKPSRQAPQANVSELQARMERQIGHIKEAVDHLRSIDLTKVGNTAFHQRIRLGDLLVEVSSCNISSVDTEEVLYVEPSDIHAASNRILTPQRLKKEDLPTRARWRLEQGDVLVHTARPNPSGIALVTSQTHGAFASGIFAVLRPDADKLLPEFLLQLLLEPVFLGQFVKMARGTALPTVSLSTIRDMMVRVPPLSTQRNMMAPLACISKLVQCSDSLVAEACLLQDNLRLQIFASDETSETDKFHS